MSIRARSKLAANLMTLLTVLVSLADGHGRLRDPPSRSSAWREGFKVPPDYNDTEGFCGGYERQWLVNQGRCGICGDPFDEMVKPHEAPGGTFATGTIVRNYTEGQTILVKIDITALHKGFYEFKICPNDNVKQDPPQSCFDRFPLTFVNGAPFTKYDVTNLTTGKLEARLKLPAGVTCRQCILQWSYVTGNRWGTCSNGTQGLGCGPQETFRACSDIGIYPSGGTLPPSTSPPVTEPMTTTMIPTTMPSMTTSPMTTSPTTMPPITTLPMTTPSMTIPPITIAPSTMPPMTMPPMTIPPMTMPPMTMPPMTTTTSMSVTSQPSGTVTPFPTVEPPIFTTVRTTTESFPGSTLPPVVPLPLPTMAPIDPTCTSYIPVPSQRIVNGMTDWCMMNCMRGYCPPSYCICIR